MIGIFGGTFDPIHYGHLRTALEVKETLGLEQVRLMPLRQAVHRDQPGTPAEIRLSLVHAAVAGTPGLVADDREISREGPSYSYHSLQSLRRQFGDELPIALILGADAFNGFLSWHRPLDILKLAHLIIMERAGHEVKADGQLGELLARHRAPDAGGLGRQPGGGIWRVEVSALEVSSTDIRRRLKTGQSIRFLVPEAVELLIRALGLYRG